jgi:hypothetical protein
LSDSDDDPDSDLEIIKEQQESEDESKDEDEDEELDEDTQGNTQMDIFQENADDEGFIDDNPDDLIGEPVDLASLPIEFSHLSRAKPRELFKYAVEWMVMKKINPSFASDDEIYELTFRKLNDEVNGLANSKFSSSVWTPDFTRALRARPDIMIMDIPLQIRSISMPHCEACNRKTHPATFNITFGGRPYHKESLEPLGGDSESESDTSSESETSISSSDSSRNTDGERLTRDAQGEIIPPESRIFTVGSTCKANAQVAHTLYHWRHHLNSWIIDYLVRKGHCAPEKLVERDGWSQRKREKAARKILKQMDKEGEIRKLHRLYKEQVDFALEARNEYTRGWGRR